MPSYWQLYEKRPHHFATKTWSLAKSRQIGWQQAKTAQHSLTNQLSLYPARNRKEFVDKCRYRCTGNVDYIVFYLPNNSVKEKPKRSLISSCDIVLPPTILMLYLEFQRLGNFDVIRGWTPVWQVIRTAYLVQEILLVRPQGVFIRREISVTPCHYYYGSPGCCNAFHFANKLKEMDQDSLAGDDFTSNCKQLLEGRYHCKNMKYA